MGVTARNPGSGDHIIDGKVLQLAREIARGMSLQGSQATPLMASYARGDPYHESDVDLTFIGPDRECEMRRCGEYLVSLSWRSLEGLRKLFAEPSDVGGLIPGLRNAFIVEDPSGVAAQLREEARSWTWDGVAQRCDAWVAGQIAGYAEDVQRMFGHLKLGRPWIAAVLHKLHCDPHGGDSFRSPPDPLRHGEPSMGPGERKNGSPVERGSVECAGHRQRNV